MVIQKSNGAVKEAHVHGGGKKHVHGGAGDDDENGSDVGSEVPDRVFPENISKRVQALKNLHVDVQSIKKEFDTKVFQLEAEFHKKLAPILKKRADIVGGEYEPNEAESQFSLKEGAPQPDTLPSDGKSGIPKFWLEVLSTNSVTQDLINEDVDTQVLEHLTDVRLVYTDKPLGFKLEFEFAENPFFTNKILTRSYEFADDIPKEELYVNSSLSPKNTAGTEIQWKDGKNITKKVTTTTQRNKKTGERRQVQKEEDVDSFFKFFGPAVTDLAALTKQANDAENEMSDEESDAFQEKLHTAEYEFEVATALRSRIIPRAVLIYTGEDDDDMDFSEDDYDDEESDEEEGGSESESEPEQPAAKKGKSPKK